MADVGKHIKKRMREVVMEQNESEGEVREETEVRRKDYHNESLPRR